MGSNKPKLLKRESRRIIGGVKLPPIEQVKDEEVKSVIDIDPHFYSLVEGRPIRPNTSINKYKHNIKDVALKRTIHAFLVDEIKRIDRDIENEKNVYNTAYKHFEECQHSFDKFLAYDNDKTIVIMKRSDNLAKDLANQTEEHKKAIYELASIKSKLQYIDETLIILLSFENFLHKAAPILWQESNNIKLDTKHSEIIAVDNDIFHKLDIDLIKDRLSKLSPPKLYFKTPNQLLIIFELMEKQNLNYLLFAEELNCEKNKFLKTKESLRNLLYEELEDIKEKIMDTEDIISSDEAREKELKEIFFKILEGKIRSLVSSQTSLEIFNYVEFAYEQLITENDTELGTLQMMMALEGEYDNLMLELSMFDLDMVKRIEKETYERSEKEIKVAKEAHKLLKDVSKLNRRLKSSYEPTRRKVCDPRTMIQTHPSAR